jgi:hypothetical protein
MIKRYLEFIKEEKFNTIGEWVESFTMMIILKYS